MIGEKEAASSKPSHKTLGLPNDGLKYILEI